MSNPFDNSRVNGFLRADGRRIVNGDGEELIPRGWGAGNWTNPEGFMLGIGTAYMQDGMKPGLALPGRFTSARTMTQVIRELCGSEYASGFWQKWWVNHLGEADIRAMAEQGYNSVRLPLTAWVLLEEEPEIHFREDGFAMLDQVLAWCEKYRVYAILDMHGTPGGQSGLACDDGLDNIPHMFLEVESRERALLLWEELAKRYADRWIVGGYDLLNEPIAVDRWHYLKPELARFYEDVIRRIRKYDKNHLLFLEGAMFATNLDIFDHNYDPECNNWGISTHLYAPSPEIRDLYRYIEVSCRLNVPVWIGEGRLDYPGMAVFYEIAAEQHMGFSLWVWKSVVNTEDSGCVTYELPEGFEAVLKYCMEGGPRPSYEESIRLFDAMLEAIRYENCAVNEKAHLYCGRRQGITLPAAGYDPQRESFSAGWYLGNPFGYRTEDHTHLVMKDGVHVPNAFSIGGPPPAKDPLASLLLQLDEGEFVSYTVRMVKTDCRVVLTARAFAGAELEILGDGLEKRIAVPAGTELADYEAVVLSPCDAYTVRVKAVKGSVQLEKILFG